LKTEFFTGQGDKGQSAFGKKKLPKDGALFGVLGDLDELNSWLGFAGIGAPKKIKEILKQLQEDLFIVQAEIAVVGFGYQTRGFKDIDSEKTKELEKIIIGIDKKIPPIRTFILPGGSELAAKLDIARTIARRTERAAVNYRKSKKFPVEALRFLNRLSSLLFALARYVNYSKKIREEKPNYR
jgi:cob(I)alamin adenosyltransferase